MLGLSPDGAAFKTANPSGARSMGGDKSTGALAMSQTIWHD